MNFFGEKNKLFILSIWKLILGCGVYNGAQRNASQLKCDPPKLRVQFIKMRVCYKFWYLGEVESISWRSS